MPPAAMVVGLIPLKVIGLVLASTRVMTAVAKWAVSMGEFTTTARVAGFVPPVFGEVCVGTVAGAVYTPAFEMDPQLGLHDGAPGAAPFGKSVVSPVTGCVTSQVRPVGALFGKFAVNWICCAGVNPTGAVAEGGVTETRIPVSKVTVTVPVFLLLAAAAAVKVRVGMGLEKFFCVGAV